MLPEQLQNYLKTNTSHQLLGGYLTILDTDERILYTTISRPLTKQYGDLEAFARTAFGDILAWDGKYVFLLKLSEQKTEIILSGFSFFFSNIEDPAYQKEYFELELYAQAVNKLGALTCDECYSFEPLPVLGGAKSVDFIQKCCAKDYISFLVNFY